MKKSVKLNIFVTIALTSLNASQAFTNPLGSAFKSTDNGGTLPAIDAYKDGIGVVVLDNLSQGIQIDNSAMNTLVYKYGEAAKASGSTIVDEVMYGSGSTNTKDKALVGNLTIDGASCNDQNAATQGETWLNGNCQGGISTNGTPCNDENIMTINDIYTNGICAGTLTVNGQTCNDNNVMTVNDIYTNGICAGTLTVNGTTCDDGNALTTGETWLNGVCQGGITQAINFSDHNPLGLTATEITLLSSYLGTAAGTTFNMIYDSAIHPRTGIEFHNRVNGNSHIVTLVKTDLGDILGGYTGSLYFTVSDLGWKTATDTKLFNLTKNIYSTGQSEPYYALYDRNSYGPSFGGGHDLYVQGDMAWGYATNYSYITNKGTVNLFNGVGGTPFGILRVVTYDIVGR